MKKLLLCIGLFLTVKQATAQEASFGSLAIDEINGNLYGWAVDYNTRIEADKRAIEECEKNGGNNCHTVLWFQGGCGVFVVDLNNHGLYGWGVANTREEAERIARAEASKRGGTNLKVRVWGCHGGNLISSNKKTASSGPKGVYMFHYVRSSSDKKLYTTNLLYESNVAIKKGDKWQWSASAESKIKPTAVKFYDGVEKDQYEWVDPEQLKVLKENGYISRNENVDWVGASEIEYFNSKINLDDLEERRVIFQKFKEATEKDAINDGFKIVHINL